MATRSRKAWWTASADRAAMPLVLQYSVSPQSPRDLYTRRGFNWTERYPRIVNALLLPICNLPPPTDLCRDDKRLKIRK
jgi:hypothetical protein